MLTEPKLEQILARIPALRFGVVGDLFLDRYLDLDARLTEPSVETGLDAYQVVRVRSFPGAAGTVINNLVALGAGRVTVLSVIGEDGEGYELQRELERRRVDLRYLIRAADRYTPTYMKPMLHEPGRPARELNRFDIKNRAPLPAGIEKQLATWLPALFEEVDALLVLDQVSEPDCGVVTAALRQRLAELGAPDAAKLIVADSRERIGLFANVSAKPNQAECRRAVPECLNLEDGARALARRTGRPVFCTRGADGILLIDPREPTLSARVIPAYAVTGPIDPVGAGDSTSAGIACAWAAGASAEEAAAFGNLVASITIQQIGTTGTALPAQVRDRWRQINEVG